MLNAVIVGVGHWGTRLVEAVKDSAKIRIVAGVSRDPVARRPFTERTGVPLVASLEEALGRYSFEAVVIATPHSAHYDDILRAARIGKHVYVEKPMTLSRASAERAIEACQAAGITLGVGFNRRFAPADIELFRRVRAGAVGEILHVEGQHSGPTGYQYQDIKGHWRATRAEAPGGGMTARGMHTVDTMVQIAGLVRSVYAFSERRALDVDLDDTTAMMLRFAGGATGYHATVFATADYCRVTAYGTRGWIEMIDDRDLTVKDLKGSVEKSTFPAPNKERGVLEGFADAVAAGEQFMVPPEHVINSVALLEAIVASALGHREITIA